MFCKEDSILLLDKRTQTLVESYIPDKETLDELREFFYLFSDSTRLKMLSALSISSMCVSDLAKILSLNQTTVSHQLRLLKNAGAVKSRRHGKVIFYSIKNPKINDVMMWGIEYLGY
ncbi:MAG: metalloregulator ArsR/SmtB family transcription factor [Clostridia bacterium]|nr:metalloregulator ArsR/SmtB family transcription factor [Clostridia bacterium]